MECLPWYLLDEVGVMHPTWKVSRNGFLVQLSETDLVFQLELPLPV